MRKLDNKRVEGFVKKHDSLKRWISIMLVVALLVTTATMYSLNKSANALSEDNAEDVGMVLESTGGDEALAEGDNAGETDSVENDENSESAEGESTESESQEEADSSDEAAASENSAEDTSIDEGASNESADENADASENSDSSDNTENSSSENGESSVNTENNGDGKAPEEGTPDDTDKLADNSGEGLKDSNDIELTEDVVLTVSYVTEDNEPIADEKEINLSESLDFNTEAPKQEGYEFKQASIDGSVISKIIAKQDANGHKYYEALIKTGEGDSVSDGDASYDETEETVVIKENKTVVLTYKSLEAKKTEYVYEDEKVKVTATLEYPDAVPDDAEFVVKEVTTQTEGYNYDAYLKALNDGEEQGIKNHNALNTILYDVGFFVNKTDEEGNVIEGEKIEYQPKEGTVKVQFEFLDGQLSNLLEANDNESEIEIDHLPLSDSVKEKIDTTSDATEIETSDIQKEKVGTVDESSAENVEISLDNFSIVGFSAVKKGSNVYKFSKNNRTLTYTENSKKDAFLESKYFDDSLTFGVAGNFHIVAFGTAKLSTHTNGNVLANTLYAGTNFGTNNIEDEISYAQNITAVNERMASKENHTLAVGDSVNVGLWGDEGLFSVNNTKVAAPYNIIQDTATGKTPYIDLGKVKSEVQAISNKMAGTSDGDVEVKTEGSSKVFTYTGIGGAGYKKFTGSQWNSLVSGNELKFEFPSDYEHQSIIVNIDCSDVSTILYPTKASVITVNGNALSTGEEKAVKAGRVVYNFTNVNGKDITLQEVFGQIIALGANLTVNNGNGNFIAENVTITGETHRRDFVGTTEKGAVVSLEAKKLVNGKEPGADQKFTFKAEKMIAVPEGSKNVQFTGDSLTGTNVGSKITLDVSEFIENKKGTYYVLLSEVAGTDASMNYDQTRYLAEIIINSKKDGNKTIYYAETINYYLDNWKKVKPENVVFNNKVEDIPVYISLNKYVDDKPAPLNTSGKFKFSLRMLNSDLKSWKKNANGKVKEATITNNASIVSYEISPSEWGMTYGGDSSKANDKSYQDAHTYYFMITENDLEGYAKDSTGILVKVKYYTGNSEIKYYRISTDEVREMESKPGAGFYNDAHCIDNKNPNPDKKYHNGIFYNTTGGGMLRIHKMVINDFGSKLVRDGDNSMLKMVTFRITNTATGKYIIMKGFVDRETKKGHAIEYNSNGTKTGKGYDTTYNQGAQWTISGLPAGTYTVEEVGDGLTFEYVESSNSSQIIEQSKWSRVTKYDVTTDVETGIWQYGTGGNNERVVFSADLTTDGNTEKHHLDVCPSVSVGDISVGNTSHTQTVQVCNYYSIPVGPIQVTKKFTGGKWENMNFVFNIQGVSCIARDSAGNEISGVSVPMPEYSTVTLSNPTTVNNGSSSSAAAVFGAIAFRYEGEYFYKITEQDTGIDGVKYDSNVYYVKIEVKKKYTTALKTYSAGNMTSLAKYKQNGSLTSINDDFYYLGADITYTNKKGEKIAEYELLLKPIEKANEKFANEFDVINRSGSLDDVVFVNSIAGDLNIKKVWTDPYGNDDSAKHTKLDVYIYQRVEGGEWKKYGDSYQLTPNNNWTLNVPDLPMMDEYGNKFEYCVKEPDEYLRDYAVTYTYNGKVFNAPNEAEMAEYKMTSNGKTYGMVTITNKYLMGYELPRTGGGGTTPFVATGLGLLSLSLIGLMYLRKKREGNISE